MVLLLFLPVSYWNFEAAHSFILSLFMSVCIIISFIEIRGLIVNVLIMNMSLRQCKVYHV